MINFKYTIIPLKQNYSIFENGESFTFAAQWSYEKLSWGLRGIGLMNHPTASGEEFFLIKTSSSFPQRTDGILADGLLFWKPFRFNVGTPFAKALERGSTAVLQTPVSAITSRFRTLSRQSGSATLLGFCYRANSITAVAS